ncbi:MAG TPA: 16S rRNA (adenine(1518)-N(6)/adenine(1519)-N(6))-dimethyltransferase RsmA [Burkholderiales bacterium]
MPHRPRKRFSQNFLIDDGIIADIIAAIAPRPGDNMVEIGPGQAALTQPLAARVHRLHVIEIDRDLAAALRQRFDGAQVVIHEGDALEFDFAALGPQLRVVGNLPYHISTPILFRLVERADQLRDAHVMLQREVADRMVAAPGDSDYGRLSVMLQYHFDLEKVLDVPAECFYPAPKVESAVVRMQPHGERQRARDEGLLGRIVTAAFAQRRKTLRNTLSAYLGPRDYDALGIDPGMRAQALDVPAFVRIADYVAARGSTPTAAR